MDSAICKKIARIADSSKALGKPAGGWGRPGRVSKATNNVGPLKNGVTASVRPLAPASAASAELRGVKRTSASSSSTAIVAMRTAKPSSATIATSRAVPAAPAQTANKARAVPEAAAAGSAGSSSSSASASPSAVAGKARSARVTSTSVRRATLSAAATASASTSSSPSYDNVSLPLVLDPRRPNSDAVLLKNALHPWDSAVWLIRHGSKLLVVKQAPYHTLQRAAAARRVLISRGQQLKDADFTTAEGARKESATVVQMPGIFVQPLLVQDRECSRDAGDDDETCPDREVLTVFPYYSCGDAGQYIAHVATPLIAALASGNKRRLEAVVKQLVGMIIRLSRAMFLLVNKVHEQGFILIDHKLENMVYDHVRSRWQLIDAEEVHRCATLNGPCRHTPAYAAPEQMLEEDTWTDASSDVFACGRCIQRVVADCWARVKAALGEGTKELADADKAFCKALAPLKKVVDSCTEPEPSDRPSAEAALHSVRVLRVL